MEEKLINILNVCKKNPNVILFVDEIHSLVNLGESSDGASSAGNIIKPYITRGEIQIIGATTDTEYTKTFLKDKAFARRFHECKIQEPTREETIQILEGLLPVETEFFNKKIQHELLERVVDLSQQYTLDQANPAKSINMLELACAYSKVFEDKNETVDVNAVIQSVKLKYEIYISDTKYEDTKKALHDELLGQDKALDQVCRNLKVVEKGLCDVERPRFSMLFCGSTGVGKTQACKIIAKHFFGSEKNLVKINCSEYSSEMDVSKLVGASSGYVGYDDEPMLLKQVKAYPNSIVLFDEIEKAHKAVYKVLLNILDEGEMVDNKGNRVSFKNTIIVFTTNLGCNKDTGKEVGMGLMKHKSADSSAEIMKAIEGYFSPEFLGRLDDIVMFSALPESICRELIERCRKEFEEVSGMEIKFTEDDINDIIKEAKIETSGARGLKRAVRKQIINNEMRKEEVNA